MEDREDVGCCEQYTEKVTFLCRPELGGYGRLTVVLPPLSKAYPLSRLDQYESSRAQNGRE